MADTNPTSLDLPGGFTPAELDAWIEGELPPERSADLERLLEVAPEQDALPQVVRARRAFLGALARGRSAYDATLPVDEATALEARVRTAIAPEHQASIAGARRPWLRVGLLAAAVMAIALGLPALMDRGQSATALDLAILDAADLSRIPARTAAGPNAGCADGEVNRVLAFPPVREGVMQVEDCAHEGEGTAARVPGGIRARLIRFDEMPAVGFVALPAEGTEPSHRIGLTDLGDVAVYDLRYGDTTYVLAVPLTKDLPRPLQPDCTACHNQSRLGEANPHTVFLRRAP